MPISHDSIHAIRRDVLAGSLIRIMKFISLATRIQSIHCHFGSGSLGWCAGVLSYLDLLRLSTCTSLSLYQGWLDLRGCSTDVSGNDRMDRSPRQDSSVDLGQLPTDISFSAGSNGYQRKPFNRGLSPMEQVRVAVGQMAACPTTAIHTIEEQFRQLRSGRGRLRLTPLT